jgi:hypothetical protein
VRDYAKASPKFWTGDFGKSIRGDHFLQALAWYLITAPAGNMVGLYVLPAGYIATDLGSPLKGTLKGLDALGKSGFAHYDQGHETVWVVEQARHELGEQLEETDNRVKRVRRLVADHCKSRLFRPFLEMYAAGYHLLDLLEEAPPVAPLEAPSEGVSRVRVTRARSSPSLVTVPSPALPPELDTPAFRLAWERRLRERGEASPSKRPKASQLEAQLAKLVKVAAARGLAHAIFCVERATENGYQGVVFVEDFEGGSNGSGPAPQARTAPYTAITSDQVYAIHPDDPNRWHTPEQWAAAYPELPWPG